MVKSHRPSIVVAALLAIVFACAPNAWAANTTCTTFMTGDLPSLVVPAGAVCVLSNAIVDGNITVSAGSQLFIQGGVTVNGNVTATDQPAIILVDHASPAIANIIDGNVSVIGASYATICGAVIGGNVTITNTAPQQVGLGGSEPGAACAPVGGGNIIWGNVSVEGNAVAAFRVADNIVSGNMSILANTGPATKRVLNNRVVQGHLTCSGNDTPFVIGGNQATKLIGQCQP